MTAPRQYYKQLHRHSPDEGLIGDCWRTCIANLMGLKPTEVPHFLELHPGGGTDPGPYRQATSEWLAKRNLQLISFAINPYDQHFTGRLGAAVYILGGRSGRSDISHVVLATGHFQLLFDPANAPRPLQPFENEDDQEYYWLDFIVPINLAAFLENPVAAPLLSDIVIPSATR